MTFQIFKFVWLCVGAGWEGGGRASKPKQEGVVSQTLLSNTVQIRHDIKVVSWVIKMFIYTVYIQQIIINNILFFYTPFIHFNTEKCIVFKESLI